jgi:hypothetical protein
MAWGGGGGDGYGLHDWVVDSALLVLDGRVGDWFDAETARLATDDPDTIEPWRTEFRDHVYHEQGRRGGGVHRIASEFDIAQAAYQRGAAAREAGDETTAQAEFTDASHHIGLLSHIVADLSQPFHTAYAAQDLESLHQSYEALTNVPRQASDMPEWTSSDRSVAEIGNIRTFAARTAAYSRSLWPELRDALRDDGMRLSSRVSRVTGLALKRAAEDLADIIWSISRGVGAAPAVGSLKVAVRWSGVAAGGKQAVFVTARDVNGKPIEGLLVDVAWPTTNGTRIDHLYTDPDGWQQRWDKAGTGPKNVRLPVVATTTIRGVTTTARSGWTISPRLASGSNGFRASVNDGTVRAGSTVRVTARARSAAGNPVRNLLVTFTWKIGSATIRTTALTDAEGRARSSYLVTDGTSRKRVTVTARTQAGSQDRSATTTWIRVD